MRGNLYGRVLPIDRQEASPSTACVDCGHPHWDRLQHSYVRCGICPCRNVGRNEIPLTGDEPDHAPRDIVDEIDALVDEQMAGGEPWGGFDADDPAYPKCPHCGRHWHGLPITERIAAMYHRGRYDESYAAAEDTTRILCQGSTFIGPMPRERWSWESVVQHRGDVSGALLGALGNPRRVPGYPYRWQRMVEFCERTGIPLLPWQQYFLGSLHPQRRWWRLPLPADARINEYGSQITVMFGDTDAVFASASQDTWIDETATPRTIDVLAASHPPLGGTWEPITAPGVETHPTAQPRAISHPLIGTRITFFHSNGRSVTGAITAAEQTRGGYTFTIQPEDDAESVPYGLAALETGR